jgi:hypothetical protein
VIGGGTALASNYTFNTATSTTAGTGLNTVILSTKTLTVNGTLADSKVYDGTTSVNVWGGSLVGIVGGDVVTLKQAGTFNSANVGSAVAVLVSDSISGASSSNYNLVQPTGVTAAITVKTLTVSDGTVANKTYDGTNNAVLTGGSLIGVVTADVNKVTLVQAGSFSSPNVSNGIIIIANDSITGSAASNYKLVQPTGITANITPAMLGIQVVGVANGTNNITPISFTINGLINGQTITGLSSVTVSSSSISSNGSNFVTGIVISGGTALATNYAFAPTYSSTAGIGQNIATLVAANQKVLTVTGTVAVTKVYDGTTAITITGGTLVGLTSGDAANVTLVQSAVLTSANVSNTASVIISDSITGTAAANYILVQPSGVTAIITPAPLGITVTAEYNGTTSVTPSTYAVTGLVAGQTITGLSSATVNNANVANNGSNFVTSIVTSGGTASLSNYSINSAYNATAGNTKNVATIAAKALTVGSGSVVADKIYDGSTAATITGGSLVGVIGSDVVNLTQVGAFAQSAVGNSITVTAADTLTGAASSNYSIIQPTGLTASITPKTLTVSGISVSNKVYDATTAATASTGSLVGLISADASKVTLTQSASFLSANVGNSIPVTVYESITGTAAANYTIIQPSGLSANITPKSLTVTGTTIANKVYDGTTAATVTAGTLVGLVTADIANVTFTKAASFSSANAGNGITIVMNDSISGSAASNYTLSQPTGITANITPKGLTVAGTTIANKVYDGSTSAAISGGSLVGVVSGDTVGLSQSASFNQSNAGTGLAVTVADTLTNNTAGNYTLTQPAGFTASITPAPIVVSIASQTKEYDTTNAAALTAGTSSNAGSYTLSGFVSGQGAYITQASATYNSANVANASTVTASLSPSNYIATGSTNLSNYSLPTSVSATGSITPATLTMAANAAAKFVGQTDPSFSYTLSGLKGADTSSVLISPTVTRPVGEVAGATYTLTPSATAANYMIVPVTASFNIIAQGQLLIKVGNTSTAYGTLTSSNIAASATVSASYCTIGADCSLAASIVNLNVVAGTLANTWIATDAKTGSAQGNYTLTINPPTLTSSNSSTGGYLNVGTYTFTPSTTVVTNPNYSTNYATGYPVLTVPGTIAITPLALSISAPTQTKVYDANNVITGKTLTASNAVSGDQLSIIGSGTYANANAGTGKSYTINTIVFGGVDAANYSAPTSISATNGIITAAVLTISGVTVANKTYDGTYAASFSGGTLNGVVSSDLANLTLTQAGTFSQINVGDNLTVTAANVLGGSAAANYSLTQPTGLTADIIPKTLTVTGTTVANKTYNGNDVATVTGGTLVGVVGSDNVSLVQAGSFSGSNVGTGLAVTIADTLTNNAAGNYILTQPTGFTANITAKTLTVSGTSVSNKTYDGNYIASVSGGSLNGLIAADNGNITLTEAGNFSRANVGTGLTVTIADVLSGPAAANYTLTQPTGITANIIPKALTVTGTTVANKVYDRTNTAIVTGGTLEGVIPGEVIGLVQAGTFGQINVGTGLAVTIADTLINNAAGNYSLTQPTGLTADITPKALTVTGTTVANKIYNGNNVATIANGALVGVVGGDTVSLNQAATFSQSDVGTALVVTAANTLSNNAAGNYTLVQPAGLTADIMPKALTVSGAAVANKVYDGTTAATFTAGTLTGKVGSDDVVLTQVGNFSQASIGTGLTVTATSVLSGTAASNYTLTQPTGLTANITTKSLTVSGAVIANKVYDGTRVATFSAGTVDGVVSTDTASLVVTQGATFSQANVGNSLTATAAYTISGSAAGNYTLTQPTGLSANITPAPLGITMSTIYSGSTTIIPTSYALTGLVNGETITGISSATVNNANVSANSSNFVTVFSSSGGTATLSNYALNSGYNGLTGNTQNKVTIVAKSMTVTADNVSGLVYGSAYALGTSAFTTSGLVGTDTVTAATLSYGSSTTVAATTNAGSYSAGIIPSAAVGTGLNNYAITYIPANLTVGKAALTITPNGSTSVFNSSILDKASYSQAIANYTVSGYKNADSAINAPISISGSMNFGGASNTVVQNAGTYSLAIGSIVGSSSNPNYTVVFANTANNVYKIDPAILSITASKVYDGSRAFAASSVNAVTTNGNQVVALSGSANADSSDVIGVSSLDTTGLSIANSTFANNYILPASTGSISITPAPITVSINSQTKVYDATNSALLTSASYTISGFATNQGASINQTSATYNSANVANATTVSTTLSNANYVVTGGTNLSNYSLPLSVSGPGSITRATLTMTANAAAKFVGQADPTLTYSLTGLKGADTASVLLNPALSRQAGETATSDAPNNGTPYTITPSATAANYTIVPVSAGFTVVAQGQLLLTVANTSTTYGSLTASNLGASAAVSASYCTINSNCSAQNIVNLAITTGSSPNTWIATDSKSPQGKYTLTINLPSLTSTDSSSGGYLNVGSYILTPSSTVTTVSGYATNYVTSYPVLTVAGTTSITPLILSVNAPNIAKVYDATSVIIGKPLTASNVALNDQVVLSGSGSFTGANAGTSLAYTINNILISGADANNYAFSGTISGANGVITPAPLLIGGISANNKVYDATTTAIYSGTPTLIGVVQGDTVSVLGSPRGSFSQSDVGSNLSISFNNSSLSINSANYSIAGLALSQSANITPAPITVAATKLYDGLNTVSSADLTITGIAGQTLVASSGNAILTNPNVGSAALQGLNNLVLANGTGLAGNYTTSNPIFTNVTIIPAALTIIASSDNKTYGSSTTANNVVYDNAGIANSPIGYSTSGIITGTNDAVTAINLTSLGGLINASVNGGNSYTITPSAAVGPGLGNYNITYVDAALTVTPAPINIVSDAKSMTYGASSLPSLTYAASGLVNGDTLAGALATIATAYNGTAGSASNVGTYAINQGTLAASNNYTINFTPGVLTVNPAALTITGTSQTTTYGTVTTLASNAFTATGLVNGDTITSVSAKYNGSATVPATVNAGTYTNGLVMSGAAGTGLGNYNIDYRSGDLVVLSPPVTAQPVPPVVQPAAPINGGVLTVVNQANVQVSLVPVIIPPVVVELIPAAKAPIPLPPLAPPAIKYIDNPNTVFVIRAATNQEGMQLTVNATATGTGFTYTLPDNFNLIMRQNNANISSSSSSGGTYTVAAVMADTSQPLPEWLKFDPTTKTLIAEKVPVDVDVIRIKLVAKRGDSLVGEAEMIIQPKQ